MREFLNRLLKVQPGEWSKLAPFALLGFLLQMGLGIGFAAGDAAFLSHVGADRLALVFLLTPVVMLLYTGIFSYLLVRYSIDRVVDATVGLLVAGGLVWFALLGTAFPPSWEMPVYLGLKLYLAMWYIALYTLFWNYTDGYFTIQDGKRIFPLLAAAMAFGTTCGGIVVTLLADVVPLRAFFLIWAGLSLLALPVALILRRRWKRMAESEVEEGTQGVAEQVGQVGRAFRGSRYTLVLTLVLFVTLLLTNLAEFQYATIFQQGRSEAELAALLGKLYAGANIFNMLICLFVFNRLVSRAGVRNVALILPLAYFAAFGLLLVTESFEGALAAFFAYHGILTSIEYNNQNLLFNAVPSESKQPVRTIVEGLCEPLASFVSGGFLLFAAARTDMRDLSGIGVLLGALLLVIVIVLRQLYPAAMARNMRAMGLDFGPRDVPRLADPPSQPPPIGTILAKLRSHDRAQRHEAVALLQEVRDLEAVPQILASSGWLGPEERHHVERLLVDWGETVIPRAMTVLSDRSSFYRSRAIAARVLVRLANPLFNARLDGLVRQELDGARPRFALIDALDRVERPTRAMRLLARLQRQQIAAAADFAIELLALGGRLPDFDLLIVSLHSQNAKVRANAIEAIENGVDNVTFAMLRDLIDEDARSIGPATGDLPAMLDLLLPSTNPIEVMASAQVLRDLVPPSLFAARVRPAIRPGMNPAEREALATLLGLPGAKPHTLVDVIDAIAAMPSFAAATIDAQARLALRARPTAPSGDAVRIELADAPPLWLPDKDIRDIASRYADLALTMLKASDDRAYAA